MGLLFPDGRLPRLLWRPLAWFVGVWVFRGTVATALSRGRIGGLGALRTPLGIEGAPTFSDRVEVVRFAFPLGAAALCWRACAGQAMWSACR